MHRAKSTDVRESLKYGRRIRASSPARRPQLSGLSARRTMPWSCLIVASATGAGSACRYQAASASWEGPSAVMCELSVTPYAHQVFIHAVKQQHRIGMGAGVADPAVPEAGLQSVVDGHDRLVQLPRHFRVGRGPGIHLLPGHGQVVRGFLLGGSACSHHGLLVVDERESQGGRGRVYCRSA